MFIKKSCDTDWGSSSYWGLLLNLKEPSTTASLTPSLEKHVNIFADHDVESYLISDVDLFCVFIVPAIEASREGADVSRI